MKESFDVRNKKQNRDNIGLSKDKAHILRLCLLQIDIFDSSYKEEHNKAKKSYKDMFESVLRSQTLSKMALL
jgi:hypothetical protein